MNDLANKNNNHTDKAVFAEPAPDLRKKSFKAYFLSLDMCGVFMPAAAIYLLLNPLLCLLNSVRISENLTGRSLVSQDYSFFDLLGEIAADLPAVNLFIVAGILLIVFAEFLLLYPLFLKKDIKKYNIVLLLITDLLALISISFYFVMIFITKNTGDYSEFVKIQITLPGLFLIYDTISLTVCSFALMILIKNNGKAAGI